MGDFVRFRLSRRMASNEEISQAEMEEAELQRVIALSLEEAGLAPATSSSGLGIPPVPSFEDDIQKAIALSLSEQEKFEAQPAETTGEQDLNRAIAMGLESARRQGYSLSDPEEDLKRALAESLKIAKEDGLVDDEAMATLEPLFGDMDLPPLPPPAKDAEDKRTDADKTLDQASATSLVSAVQKLKTEGKKPE